MYLSVDRFTLIAEHGDGIKVYTDEYLALSTDPEDYGKLYKDTKSGIEHSNNTKGDSGCHNNMQCIQKQLKQDEVQNILDVGKVTKDIVKLNL